MFLVYFLSGFTGLLYEVVWLRLLALAIGHTAGAVATTLAAFMGGLAGGAALAGRWLSSEADESNAGGLLHQRARALRLYAALEILIAACALALPFALDALGPVLARAYGDAGGLGFGLLRIALCLTLISIPAAAMGATYPLAVRAARSTARPAPSATAGRLYAVNTGGAALGAALTGFLLLPAAGMWRTTLLGVAINVIASAAAVWLSRQPLPAGHAAPPPRARSRTRPAARPVIVAARLSLAAGVVFASGFIALVSEVAWTRVLALAFGPTTYAFSIMLVSFIGGLAAGAGIGARLATRPGRSLAYLAGSLVVVAIGTWSGVAWIEQMPLTVGTWVAAPDARFGSVLVAESLLCGALLLPVTMALGAVFPLALACAAGEGRPQASAGDNAGAAGSLFAANTTGGVLGSLAAGFAIIPWAGIRGALLVSASLALTAGAVLVWMGGSGARRRIAAAVLLASIAAGWALPAWNLSVLTGGAYKYAPSMRQVGLREALEAGTLVYYREGSAGTVSVRRTAGRLSLAIDGKVDASNGGDMLTQKLLAHLPLLAHAAPRRVAVIGLGSGVTAGAALRHPVERVDVIEISREVVAASRLFDADSGRPLDDPRTRLILGDARTHIALSPDRYDVIISEPSNPWMAGVASLFTREFFEAVRRRLAPGGVVCQWAHAYDIREDDLRSIVATFAGVFPATTMWLIGDADVLLLGSTSPSDRHADAIAREFARAGVGPDLASVGVVSPFGLVSLLVVDEHAIAGFAAGADLQRDDRLQLEFSGPRSIIGAAEANNARAPLERARANPPAIVAAARASADASDWVSRGEMLLRAGSTAAMDDFALALGLGDGQALDGLHRAALAARRVDEALTILEGLARTRQTDPSVDVTISRLLAGSGDLPRAAEAAARALRQNGAHVGALTQLASVQADAGDAEGLAQTVARLRTLAPAAAETQYYDGVLAYQRGDFRFAAARADETLAAQPGHARALTLSGAAYASLGDLDRARKTFEAAVAATPDDPAPYVNLGQLELGAWNARRAADWFTEALAVDPTSTAARDGLATALERRGEHARASRLRGASR